VPFHVRRISHLLSGPHNTGISGEAAPASNPAGAGMRRHVHSANHAAESFVSFIPLFDRSRFLVHGKLERFTQEGYDRAQVLSRPDEKDV
jgi:hypothetical protein